MTERSLLEQRTVALAGVAQAARIVDLAAKTGSWPLPLWRPRYIPCSALIRKVWRRYSERHRASV